MPPLPSSRLSRRERVGADRPRSGLGRPGAANPAGRAGTGLRATIQDRPFAGIAGDKLRAWFEKGGIPRSEFYARIHFAAVTRCYPGRISGARGDRLPSPDEQALCRPWLDELIQVIEPRIILLVGSLAIRTLLGPFRSLSDVVGTGTIRDGVRYLPLPHPSGVSRWLNEPANVAAVDRAMHILSGWIEEMAAPCPALHESSVQP